MRSGRLLLGMVALVFAGSAVWLFDQHELNVAESYRDPFLACQWAEHVDMRPLPEPPTEADRAAIAADIGRITRCLNDPRRGAAAVDQYEREMIAEQNYR